MGEKKGIWKINPDMRGAVFGKNADGDGVLTIHCPRCGCVSGQVVVWKPEHETKEAKENNCICGREIQSETATQCEHCQNAFERGYEDCQRDNR